MIGTFGNNVTVLQDLNGNLVTVSNDELLKAVHTASIYGMSLSQIGKLRRSYLRSGGRLPITDESIDEVYKVKGKA